MKFEALSKEVGEVIKAIHKKCPEPTYWQSDPTRIPQMDQERIARCRFQAEEAHQAASLYRDRGMPQVAACLQEWAVRIERQAAEAQLAVTHGKVWRICFSYVDQANECIVPLGEGRMYSEFEWEAAWSSIQPAPDGWNDKSGLFAEKLDSSGQSLHGCPVTEETVLLTFKRPLQELIAAGRVRQISVANTK